MITLTLEEARFVLDALEGARIEYDFHGNPVDISDIEIIGACKTLRARLAQPDHFADARKKVCQRCGEVNPAEVHTCSPQREWQGLTDEDRWELVQTTPSFDETVAAVEAKLKEKNT